MSNRDSAPCDPHHKHKIMPLIIDQLKSYSLQLVACIIHKRRSVAADEFQIVL